MKPNAFLFFLIILILLLYYTFEYFLHNQTLKKFKHRIHVNGTRGKSSVTRLIRAGLSATGMAVFAKTTGTMARMIFPDGSEESISRFGKPSILEQIKILKKAKRMGAEIVVLECMALEPRYQWASEGQILKSDIGVITNIREDHLEVMGPELTDVAKSLLSGCPAKGTLITGPTEFESLITNVCKDRKSKPILIQEESIHTISDEEMRKFSYWEHKENVYLALQVCETLGVDRNMALEAMWKVNPDPGALSVSPIHFFGKEFIYVNAMAANDPDSTKMIWSSAIDRYPQYNKRYILFHTRDDRPERSRQLTKEFANWEGYDAVILIGSSTSLAFKYLKAYSKKDIPIFVWEHLSLDGIFESLLSILPKQSMVFGIGNIVGLGMELSLYLKNRSEQTNE
ncbi:poly-gamma-glutamate synthase PgsB [Leptospira sp. 2 VSF19]|uniref:Poly-gamma-glutamate synthase PgsB n=1 Tax=Leptospira soteropolitanensis TaxID=2950025 RepID=A0AAW5VN82_9LEPT|nr:poly-gamma-glutamate synthase PgsB [Leptospira soteropolitanensis]MCW7494104.1 poly-gamma-glutamate synthase PgsB [Leptospira soteropolitanensis]MCW7501630.1 poly-gamma-glutamate synthase PgsB [Leptospira soteropolitanensis]MCW7523950.1 poly-gamma-glutamate synthase PgsB [Leptospira soteropolitanensis]MCW7527815.1 poly-gamma-glutamate synthase PgsB [Leptospira soteropolitanensis]MCW7531600.1 poly-gamma-glutamate synthase PgsB [Leptospira soteropolitanensis]